MALYSTSVGFVVLGIVATEQYFNSPHSPFSGTIVRGSGTVPGKSRQLQVHLPALGHDQVYLPSCPMRRS